MNKIYFQPAEQRVLVLPDDPDQKIGNIYIPTNIQQDKPRFGYVISIGSGSIEIPMRYYMGQRVMFSHFSGVEVELNIDDKDRKYLVMNQLDIMGVIIEDKV
jgi:co-chaperonin GroES (HSP10)